MASNQGYETLDEIEAKLKETIQTAMEGYIEFVVEKVLQSAVDEMVYQSLPGRYERRGDSGGLRDRNNYVSQYDPDSMTLTMRNETKGTFKHKDMIIDDAVEAGTNYDYGGNAKLKRPFYKRADELLTNNSEYLNSIEDFLNEMLSDI